MTPARTTMQANKRKREVSSCIPCYTRKQKCDRQYPCDRCSRRRRPELCAYASPQSEAPRQPTPTKKSRDGDMQMGEDDNWEQDDECEPSDVSTAVTTSGVPVETPKSSSVAEVFGDYGQSEFNTMALVRKLVHEDDVPHAKNIAISNEVAAEVGKVLDMMLDRPILDFLVRYFVAKVNWFGTPSQTISFQDTDLFIRCRIDQLLYPPWFLGQYQTWWSLDRLSSVADIEFCILFLRTCCYASHFLPSPTHTIDGIKGVSLADIRKSCEEIINALVPICARLDPRGSLIRVQHIVFAGLGFTCLGQINASWDALSCATRVAQQISLHLDAIVWPSGVDELEKEMSRRTYCSLYTWDICLAKRLDRIPFLSNSLSADMMPRMHLPTDIDIGADAPDVFTERVLRTRLAQFWRNHGPDKSSEYNAIAAEERYESFCSTFLQTMPPVFALQPDKQWDKRLPTLPMQRQLLHIAIFESLCWNFKPVLFQKPEKVKHLPEYKQILISHNKRALAVAAVNLLESVSALHMMMGGSHTRFAGIIVPIFEAAVPLLCLCADTNFPGDVAEGRSQTMQTDPLGVGISNVTRAECMQAAHDALNSLQTLAEVSNMAETGARTLARLISVVDSSAMSGEKASRPGALSWWGEAPGLFADHCSSPSLAHVYSGSSDAADAVMQTAPVAMQTSEVWTCDEMREYVTGDSWANLPFDNTICAEVSGPNWDEVLWNL